MKERSQPRRTTSASEQRRKGGTGNRGSTTRPSTEIEGPIRGTHNRPWEAEEEYLALRRQQREVSSSMEAAPASAPYSRYLEAKHRDDYGHSKRTSVKDRSAAVDSRGRDDERHTHTLPAHEKVQTGTRPRNVVEEVAASLKNSGEEEVKAASRKSSSRRPHPVGREATSSDVSAVGSNPSSRELRTRRLRQQQEERTSVTSSSAAFNSNIAANLSSLQVKDSEQALVKLRRSTLEESASRREQLASRVRESSAANAYAPTPIASTLNVPKPHRIAASMSTGGLMTASATAVRRDAPTGGLTTSSAASTQRQSAPASSSAVTGWSTLSSGRNRHLSDSAPATNVKTHDRYVGLRPEASSNANVAPLSLSTSSEMASNLHILRSKVTDSFDDDDDDKTSSDDDTSGESLGEETVRDGQDPWSVHVTVVSGVDFPPPVVPNLPLSPVLRLGLVPLDDKKCAVEGEIKSHGKARVHSTSVKILAKKDNGSVEFHEEFRWDNVHSLERLALVVQLDSKAVLTPQNSKESPLASSVPSTAGPGGLSGSLGSRSLASAPSSRTSGALDEASGMTGIGSLFRRPTRKTASEMETANAAAAVAKLLVEGPNKDDTSPGPSGPLFDSRSANIRALASNQSEIDVKLRPGRCRRKTKLTKDLFLGSSLVPLTTLPLDKVMKNGDSARVEQWFELVPKQSQQNNPSNPTSPISSSRRNPSVLLEITVSSGAARDESEDEMDDVAIKTGHASFAKRTSHQIRSHLKEDVREELLAVDEEPELVPGIIDFAFVVGARDIGDQKLDDGSSGWVNSTPECCVLEQFPDDSFHASNGRKCVLPNKVEWFCFPEGCRLWRGATPPNLDELNLKRFSASSPANISTTIASFDACLGCTTSFSWFVISSHAEEYGSESAKTFGAVIRFFVPAPAGIDSTQDDFAQTLIEGPPSEVGDVPEGKRLWVPIGIGLTSSLPIVGTMEAMLLRLCEALAAKGIATGSSVLTPTTLVRDELANLACGYQRPLPGAVQCSVPFLKGEHLNVSLPPPGGMPALPHGNSVSSVCRLLGADGFVHLLAAVLTECKIILHSSDVANLCLVSEVMLALIYPFVWSLPYIPVLPIEMMEFIEAPLSYLLGIPSCNMKHIDPQLLEDVVVVDLDKDFASSDFYDGSAPTLVRSKNPTPLPATVAGNVSRAVYRLLRAEENDEDDDGFNSAYEISRSFPRLEPESRAEREFRISVAMEVCGLVRGYQDCLVFASSSQAVFNADKFLQVAPALFEEQRGTSDESGVEFSHFVLSPRSRRFISLLVNCQHFHQFLEILDSDRVSFFHEVLSTAHTDEVGRRMPKRTHHTLAVDFFKSVESLSVFLTKLENKIPTYRTQRLIVSEDFDEQIAGLDREEKTVGCRFPRDLLQQIVLSSLESEATSGDPPESPSHGDGVKQVSVEYLMELENNPWRYQILFGACAPDIPLAFFCQARVKLRHAIGERRYRAWKLELEQEKFDGDDVSVLSEDGQSKEGGMSLDLNGLIESAMSDNSATVSVVSQEQRTQATATPLEQRLSDAKDRETLRKCLEWALSGASDNTQTHESGLIVASEIALRNPSARKFLLAVLRQRGSSQPAGTETKAKRRSFSGSSKIEVGVFNILLRLGSAMLDACTDNADYDAAYAMLSLTAGIYMITGESDNDVAVSYITGHLALHPIFSDLKVWERVKDLHLKSRKEGKDPSSTQSTDDSDDEYEAVVATLYEMLGYGIPCEELARFASRVSTSNGWFKSERGHTIMLLAKRLSSRREQGGGTGVSSPSKKSDLEVMAPLFQSCPTENSVNRSCDTGNSRGSTSVVGEEPFRWCEVSWCHPAAQPSRRLAVSENARRPGTQSLLNMLDEHKALPDSKRQNPKLMKRSAVTSMAFIGSSVVATGGLDGGVFVARLVSTTEGETSATDDSNGIQVRGIHLDWGSSGSRYTVASTSNYLDGEFGVGAVSCIAATSSNFLPGSSDFSRNRKDVQDSSHTLAEEELLDALDGCRVVAGTTCGDLRVWTLKDVYSAVFFSNGGQAPRLQANSSDRTIPPPTEKLVSKFGSGRANVGSTDFSAGSSLTRLKFSLRGRALSGHRGGVSCIDVPSKVYRPDSIISGGADGLIKLWNLRSPGALGGRRSDFDASSPRQSPSSDATSPRTKAIANSDALCILSGHGGRVLCVKSAWHGDRLLSGGADRTVRVWDIVGAGGKCILSLSGHLGWVTQVRYWGPNTVVSASTDRSILLWDTRVRNRPLFSLRHHNAPVSDLLVGARADPVMFSAASDGSVAAWDFRLLRQGGVKNPQAAHDDGEETTFRCTSVRNPPHGINLNRYCKPCFARGSVLLTRGVRRERRTVLNVGTDGVVREWEYCRNTILSEHGTGHCDLISSFASTYAGTGLDRMLDSTLEEPASGMITTSWDGTVRLRTLMQH
jgi:DENN (AEX-3) domain/WD domain, G-beta repeat